ncbi:MAG TPA: GatB/YqeY domain-containing protein [Gammaproteobacteria bacterium]|nr:GatB/YqeY domain-containing protein [Gammaproteobacteria bacterium]
MALKQQILDDIKTAMRSGDKDRLGVLRMLSAAIKQREVDERIELDDAQTLAVVEKMIKQRKESAEQYTTGGRAELAEKELAEIATLKQYLPEQLSDAEIDALIEETIAATGASGIKDMGKVMGELKPRVQGRADMGEVSKKIRARLGS